MKTKKDKYIKIGTIIIAVLLYIFAIVPITIDVDDLKIMACIDDRKTDGYVYLLIDTTSYRHDLIADVEYKNENAYVKIKGSAMVGFGIFGVELTPIQVDIEGKNIKNIYIEDKTDTKLVL